MAWLIGRAVIRGEIDNTTEGQTTGRVWLLGRDEPVTLELRGDCWRDLAGATVEFENPEPELEPEVLAALDPCQRGLVGDITASKRIRGPATPGEGTAGDAAERSPGKMHNCLYVEWFSESNGRVVVESEHCRVRIGEASWRMDADAEQAQKLANLQAMRDYLAQRIGRRGSPPDAADEAGEASEHEWEQRLRESDRLTDAYQEALDKYADDPDAEQKEAFVMGWDSLLGALADHHEGRQHPGRGGEADAFEEFRDIDEADESPEDGEDDDDLAFDAERDRHPLQELAQELAMRAFDLVRRGGADDSPAGRLVSCLVSVSGKLAGVLESGERSYRPETGFVLAILRRCLQWLNEAIAACLELITCEEDPDHRRALEALQEDIFEVRDEIVELRRQLRRG